MKKTPGDRTCTFCGKPATLVDNLIGGPPEINICNECVALCNQILKIEKAKPRAGKRGGTLPTAAPKRIPTPAETKRALDEYVVGQDRTKRSLAVAVTHSSLLLTHSSPSPSLTPHSSSLTPRRRRPPY